MHEAFQCIIIATGVRRQDQIREGLATQAARSRWFWWEEMQHRWVASKVASTFGLWWPIFGVSMCPTWCHHWCIHGTVLVILQHLDISVGVEFEHSLDSWTCLCDTFFFGDRLSDTVLEQAHVVLSFNLFQHQNLGIRCTWTRSWRAPWKFRWASRCEFLHETSTAPVYPCQDTSALQEVLKKALEKATWSWRESPNIPPKVVVNDDVFFWVAFHKLCEFAGLYVPPKIPWSFDGIPQLWFRNSWFQDPLMILNASQMSTLTCIDIIQI